MPNLQAPAHWSKDFVEHLRTVHFTLIALCIGLILLASFPNKSEIEVAHEQAVEILEVTKTWEANFLLTQTQKLVKGLTADMYGHRFIAPDEVVEANFDVTTDGKHWFRPTFYPNWEISQKMPGSLGTGIYVGAPFSLNSFQELWDDLKPIGTIFVATVPNECNIITLDVKVGVRRCSMRAHASQDGPVSLTTVFNRCTNDNSESSLAPCEFEFNGADPFSNGNELLSFPIRNQLIPFDAQMALVQRSPKWSRKSDRWFSDAFRELASVYKPFGNADLDTAERILDAEARRTGDAFEAVGLKIRADVAVRCGVLLILGLQLYMLIHLLEFGSRIDRDAGFDVAWIGVYTSTLARVMLFVSLLLLPACTVVLLSIRGLRMTENKRLAWTALVASNAASLALSYFIFKVLPQQPTLGTASPETEPLKTEQPESDSPPEEVFE